tara:strand:+ start:749 stop:862 length:114 start_codon:yes stop_codon:yes gene_type:complete
MSGACAAPVGVSEDADEEKSQDEAAEVPSEEVLTVEE